MSVLIKDMEMPKECHGCRWFYFQGTSCTEPKYYLDARCKMVESGQDWYGKDVHGGWIGESIEHIPGWTGYYQYKHCVEMGTMASQCPLCELPSAQPEKHTEERTETHACDLIERQAACEYCHEDSDGYVKPIEKNNHAFVRFGMNGWEISLSAKGWNGSAKIMYCPMCGRRLIDG